MKLPLLNLSPEQTTGFGAPNVVLRHIHKNKVELLLVLGYSDIPLYTNGLLIAIRDRVKGRKISGGTCSDLEISSPV